MAETGSVMLNIKEILSNIILHFDKYTPIVTCTQYTMKQDLLKMLYMH